MASSFSIVSGIVRTVDPDAGRMTVRIPEWDTTVETDIPQIYSDNAGAEAVAVPESGATCDLLADPLRRVRVIGWSGSQAINASPGDIYLGTRAGNNVFLHRNGILELGASGLSRRFYIPLGGSIRDVFENYSAVTPGGNLTWSVKSSADKSSVQFVLGVKEFATDHKEIVVVELGDVDPSPNNDIIVAFKVFDSGEDDQKLVYKFELGKTSGVSAKLIQTADTPGAQSNTVEGPWHISTTKDARLEAAENILISTQKQLQIEASQQINLKAPQVRVEKKLSVGEGSQAVMLMQCWNAIQTHTHAVPGGPSETLQAINPGIPGMFSKDLKTS